MSQNLYRHTTEGGIHVIELLLPMQIDHTEFDKLNDVAANYLRKQETQDRLYAIGIQPLFGTPDEFAKFIPAEQQKWSKVIADAKIQKMD